MVDRTLRSTPQASRQPADLGVILGMVAICCAVDVKYNIGRICAYAAPMFVIGAAQALSWMLSERVPVREARQPNHSAR